MTDPSTLGPWGPPIAVALWAALALPHVARWRRARRASRKSST